MNETLVMPVLGAIVGALANHIYRDYRDRLVLHLSVDRFGRTRLPVALPKEIYSKAYPQGTFQQWLDKIVKWKVHDAFEGNAFKESQLKDTMNLAPQFIAREKARLERYQTMQDSLRNPRPQPTEAAAWTLSMIRHWWQQEYHKDVFVSYTENPQAVSTQLIAGFQGDINQIKHCIEGVTALLTYLEQGFAAQTPPAQRIVAPPEEPSNPRKPFVIFELLAQNSGKTETLISDRATLEVNGKTFKLKGINESVGFDVYSGKFFNVKPAAVESIVFSHHPDETTLAELNDLKQLLLDRRHKARVVVRDFRGKRYATARFLFREDG